MRTLLSMTLLALACSVLPAAAQGPTAFPTSKIAWEQNAPTLELVNSFTYRAYIDALPAVPLANRTCVAPATPTGFTCKADLPSMTPGLHSVQLTASVDGDESGKSTDLFVTLIVLQTPTGVRVIR